MHLLDLPHELLSYIVHFADTDTIHALCLTEKRNLYRIARHFLWRNVTVIFCTDQSPSPNVFSFDSGCLSAIRSPSVVVDGHFDFCLSSFDSDLASVININLVQDCISRDSGIGSLLCGATRFFRDDTHCYPGPTYLPTFPFGTSHCRKLGGPRPRPGW
ncbi:hypothetical protein EV421DRAFT_169666 [Armillaria borealis]|uniref:F-box domain-containing protein n=1 Tax=Armillaria borealis TaxID=47425 RepID=A0AA39IVW9_9AGAR|nr:hypothetical protein EV421DRAFT_169666 [Armillaria borealis]